MKPIWSGAFKRKTKGIDTYTKMLLSLDGADDATTFTDDIGTHTPSAEGTAKLDTAQYRFGNASLLLDGNSDFIEVTQHADFQWAANPFTVDFWLRLAATTGTQSFFSIYKDADEYQHLYIDSGNLIYASSASAATVTISGAWTPSTNTWYHLAVARNGNDFTTYVDGVAIGTGTDADVVFTPAAAEKFVIGALQDSGDTPTNFTNGWIDEFRISKGVARWTAAFTPPPGPYW